MMDIEYQISEFAKNYNGKLLILDMLKDIDFYVPYDINNYLLSITYLIYYSIY